MQEKDIDLRKIQIIVASLNIGVFFFLIISCILYFNNQGKTIVETDFANLEMILYIMIFVSASMFFASAAIPKMVVSKNTAANDEKLKTVLKYYIIKVALLEGGAFFGLVVFMMSIIKGAVYQNQLFWISILPSILMFVATLLSFPNKDRVDSLYNSLDIKK